MPSTLKSLKVTYDPVNEENTFTSGDCVSGRVTLEVAKDCELDGLMIKFKGKAQVLWTERHGQTTVVYHAKDKYFSIKHHFIRTGNYAAEDEPLLTKQNGEPYSCVVAPGFHVYPFIFQIPFQEMPSSFTGSVGKVVYSLEARASRSMRIDKKESTKINFVSKTDFSNVPGLMTPQHDSKDKKMKLFTSGKVAMDVDIEKLGFRQGERLKVRACIQNNSSREIKPKYSVYKKHSFFARGRRKLSTQDLLKEVGEPIPPSSSTTVTRVITIPHDAEPSILNCTILKVEYRLRVYLDIKYASDPDVKFPIVILPASHGLAVAPPPAAAGAAGGFGFGFEPFGDQNPPTWGTAPLQPPPPAAAAATAPQPFEPPPPYGAHERYPPVMNYGNRYQ